MKKNNDLVKFLEKTAKVIKKNILKLSYKAHVGHIGSALSIADILTVLYFSTLRISPNKPLTKKRDRFILSKGHAASALYPVLSHKGFFTKQVLFSFCKDNAIFGVHPVIDQKKGIELSTGSLGHGLSVAIGMALHLKKTYHNVSNHVPRVFVLISDAEQNEGSIWEAIMFAAHHQLYNLIAIVDDNNYQAFGTANNVLNLQPIEKKWETFGWYTKVVNGHDMQQLSTVFNQLPFSENAPSVIIAKTKTAHGVSFLENRQEAHYLPLDKKLFTKAMKDIQKKHSP